jgi:hypothetical protein
MSDSLESVWRASTMVFYVLQSVTDRLAAGWRQLPRSMASKCAQRTEESISPTYVFKAGGQMNDAK